MGIILAYSKNKKAKVKVVGKTPDVLTLSVAISKCLAERILREKNISIKEAENFVIACIVDGIKTIKD